ncbi:hypothetical protein D5S17_24110 [Pseudonocardiaceae bacterium YIM PH 21723]|nr:hypothetical protein D5S17_24110 [Pseudonocardiaceae bacterium YIM PH 21723]
MTPPSPPRPPHPLNPEGIGAMLMTGFPQYQPRPARVFEWRVSAATQAVAASAPVHPAPPSYNQAVHIMCGRAQKAAGINAPSWLGAVFEIPGAVDLDAMGAAFLDWINRHDTLRSGFRQDMSRFMVPAEDISLDLHDLGEQPTTEGLLALLQDRFNEATDPSTWPCTVTGVLQREDSSTVYVMFDHSNTDGLSMGMLASEIEELYRARLEQREAKVRDAGSFVDFCVRERTENNAELDELSIRRWTNFVRSGDGQLSTFPLDLGVTPGQLYPQISEFYSILDAGTAARFEKACKELGGGMFPGLVAAIAMTFQELGGIDEYRTVMPVHTRNSTDLAATLGWLINVVPLELQLEGARDFGEIMRRARAATKESFALGKVPLGKVAVQLADMFQTNKRDMFSMISYMDFRIMPNSEKHREQDFRAIGAVSQADEPHLWFNRTHEELYMWTRYPETATSASVLNSVVARITAILSAVATGVNVPVRERQSTLLVG